MDKWDELTHRVQQGFLAEEPEAVMAAAFSLIAEFGRTFEQMSADLDRVATLVEKLGEPEISGELEDRGERAPPALDL